MHQRKMNAVDYLAPSGPLAKHISGYEFRKGQLEMARAVEHALAGDSLLLVEAGTGVGKTWAYLVPAILSGKRVVVSTGTRTLQDQIVHQDIPALEAALDTEISVQSMKGLNNYLCRRRYEEWMHSVDALDNSQSAQIEQIKEWIQSTAYADRSDLDLPEESKVWLRIMSGSDTRVGSRCVHYEDCFVTKLRRSAENAQLIIVNHHLFFADLALRGPHPGSVIPDYDAVIFDEAHQIDEIATHFFGTSFSLAMLEKCARDAEPAPANELDQREARRLFASAFSVASELMENVSSLQLEARLELAGEDVARMTPKLFELDNVLEALELHLNNRANDVLLYSQLGRRVSQYRAAIGDILSAHDRSRVVWLERGERSFVIGSSPVEVGSILRERLFSEVPSLVMTSATLTTAGKFDFFKQRLGLENEAQELVVDSPFEYQTQCALYTPKSLPDPRDASFIEQAKKEISRLVELTQGGAFVLCTSYAMMHALAQACTNTIEYPVFVQGDAPKATLIERFKKDGSGVLFGTASFWQGVDVAGSALRLVVIAKLPFDVPSDPLVKRRCEEIEARGESAFMQYVVPAAALTLKQGFGRLIRKQSDFGIVAILDGRLISKGYGRVFLRSLPPAQRVLDWNTLCEFWQRSSKHALIA